VVQTTPIPIPCARMFITPLMTDCEPSGACAQIWEKIRPTSHAANAQPAPVKKPTQNQTPISWRLMVEGMLDSPCGDADQEDDLNDTIIPTGPHLRVWGSWGLKRSRKAAEVRAVARAGCKAAGVKDGREPHQEATPGWSRRDYFAMRQANSTTAAPAAAAMIDVTSPPGGASNTAM
jgi:hypothetical protein